MNVKFMGGEVVVDLVEGKLVVGQHETRLPREHELRKAYAVGHEVAVELVRHNNCGLDVSTRYYDPVGQTYRVVFHHEGQRSRPRHPRSRVRRVPRP